MKREPGTPRAAFLDSGDGPVYLAPGQRITIGSSPNCDLRLDAKGVSKKHARIYLRPDGLLSIRPLTGRHVRVGHKISRRVTSFELGEDLQIGLSTVHSGAAEHHFYLHVLACGRDCRRVSRELRTHAPWALISLVLHAILIWLLLPMLFGDRGAIGDKEIGLSFAASDGEALIEEPVDPVEAEGEIQETEPEVVLSEPEDKPVREEEKEPQLGEVVQGIGEIDQIGDLDAKSLFANLGGKKKPAMAAKKPGKIEAKELRDPKFRRTVAKLRRTGFDLVFAFDSTGSMGTTIDEAKRRMEELLRLLEALVPGTRVGFITYRDRGDQYLTRSVSLGAGHFQSLSFLSSVTAGGGGDEPEAVSQAIFDAMRFQWRSGATKALIVIGDAPPHAGKEQRQATMLATRFRRRRGRVHCLVTSQDKNAWKKLSSIARAGGGSTIRLEHTADLAHTLLTAALGKTSKTDLQRLLKSKPLRGSRLPPGTALVRNLQEKQPDPVIVDGWLRATPAQIQALLPSLQRKKLSREGLFALCYLINRKAQQYGPWTPIPAELLPKADRGVPSALRELIQRLAR